MKRNITSFASALLAALLITSTVFAGSIRFSNVTFSIGTSSTSNSGTLALLAASDTTNDTSSTPTLIAQGTMTGLGKDDVRVLLEASGFPVVTCTNQGGNQASGQNPPQVSASGVQLLFGFDEFRKNGRSPFDVETQAVPVLDAVEFGCPNANWSARIDYIDWTEATITVLDLYSGQVLATQKYTCTTDQNTVTCNAVN